MMFKKPSESIKRNLKHFHLESGTLQKLFLKKKQWVHLELSRKKIGAKGIKGEKIAHYQTQARNSACLLKCCSLCENIEA